MSVEIGKFDYLIQSISEAVSKIEQAGYEFEQSEARKLLRGVDTELWDIIATMDE